MALVVKNAVKKAAPKGMRFSGDFVAALDKRVGEIVNEAAERAKSNKRATCIPYDL